MTGVYVGATKITNAALGGVALSAIYKGSVKLWPATLIPDDIAFIGGYQSAPNALAGAAVNLGPPAGSQAGDAMLVQVSFNRVDYSITPQTGDVWAYQSELFNSGAYMAWAFVHFLTAAEITAGLFAGFDASGPASTSCECFLSVSVYRKVDSTDPIDVAQFTANDTTQTTPADVTAPSLNTTTDKAMLVVAPVVNANVNLVGFPTGWTMFGTWGGWINMEGASAYLAQPIQGATGNVAVSIVKPGSTEVSFESGISLIALRPTSHAPSITLSATFPGSPHVGDVVSFDVTATLNGATGTPTITVDALAAGLSLGSTSMVDATHYKATVSGTLTTVQDVTSTFGTTGGSVSATPLVHDFDVAAAVTAASFVGANIFLSASGNAPLPTGCQAGDWLVIQPLSNSVANVTLTAPSSAEVVIAGALFPPSGDASARCWSIYRYKLTATDITNGYVAVSSGASRCQIIATRGGNATAPIDVTNTGTTTTKSGSPIPMPVTSITTTTNGALILYIAVANENQSAAGSLTAPTGFTKIQDLNDATYHAGAAYMQQTTAGATGDVRGTWTTTGTWTYGAALIAIKP